MSILKLIKKGDILIIAILLVLSVAGIFLLSGSQGETVTIVHDGSTVYTGSIFTDREIKVSGDYENTIIIENGEVWFESSNCPNQDCVHAGRLHKSSQTMACLPNKTVIRISGESEVDDIAK